MGGSSMYETMEPQMATVRYERSQVWGIDCAESLEWRGWEPGGEYVRSLVVKNVSTKTLKVKYKLPATKYFSMEFPEPIKLSPGMSATVDVTFRPIKREQYDDFIEFTVPGGTFDVKICAFLPVVAVEVRDARMPPQHHSFVPFSPSLFFFFHLVRQPKNTHTQHSISTAPPAYNVMLPTLAIFFFFSGFFFFFLFPAP